MRLSCMRDSDFTFLLVACAVLLYCNTFQAGYVWDDRAAIVGNRDVHGQDGLVALFRNDFWGQDMQLVDSHKSYRPVTVLTYRVNHMMGGLHPEGFHVGNVAIYAAAVVAMYYFSSQWMGKRAARVASLCFCFHPTHVEAVASLVGRADCLCGLLFLAAAYFYTSHLRTSASAAGYAGKVCLFVAALVLALAAALAKEVGVTVFGLLFALEFAERARACQLSHTERKRRADKPLLLTDAECLDSLKHGVLDTLTSREPLIRMGIVLMILVIFMYFRMVIHGQHTLYQWTPLENHVAHIPNLLSRVLSYGQSHFWYAAKLVYPRHLCFDYGLGCIPTVSEVLDFRNLLPLGLYTGVVWAVGSALRRMRLAYLVGWAALLAPLLPALNLLFPVGTLLAERLLFVPSVGFCMLVGELCAVDLWNAGPWNTVDEAVGVLLASDTETDAHMAKTTGTEGMTSSRLPLTPSLSSPSSSSLSSPSTLEGVPSAVPTEHVRRDRALVLYALLPVLVLCGARVVTRNIDWRVEKDIFFSALEVCPLSVKAMTNAGMFKLDGNGGSNAESIDILTRGLAVYNKQSAANINLGIAHLNDGNFYEAAASYTRSQHIAGASPKLLGYLGNTLAIWSERGGEGLDEASGMWLREAAARVMDDALAHGNSAPGTIVKRGLLALELREHSEAADLFLRAIRITEEALAQPHVPSQDLVTLPFAYGLLALARDELHQWPQAERAFRQALELNGDADCSVKNNLSMFYRERGRLEEAYALLSTCVSPAPNEVLAVHNNMGMIYADLGRWSDALTSYQAALGTLPPAVPAAVGGSSEDSDAAARRESMVARIQANVREVLAKQQKAS